MVHRFGKGEVRGAASAVGLAATAVALAATLAACASTTTQPGAISVSGASLPASTAASSSASASATGGAGAGASPTVNPGGPMLGTTGPAAKALIAELPKGAKLVAVQSLGRSANGLILYLGVEAQGGACGKYTTVSTASTDSVLVGLAQIPKPAGVMCPMVMRKAAFVVKLSSPLDGRTVVDLATGRTYTDVPVDTNPAGGVPAGPASNNSLSGLTAGGAKGVGAMAGANMAAGG